jgi:hypothetical protein
MSNDNETECCANCGLEGVELVQTTECNDGTTWCECAACRDCDARGKEIRAVDVTIAYFRALVPMTARGLEFRINTGVDPVQMVAHFEAKLAALLAERAA